MRKYIVELLIIILAALLLTLGNAVDWESFTTQSVKTLQTDGNFVILNENRPPEK